MSWINVYFQSIWWLGVVGEIQLTLNITFSGKKQSVFEAQKAIQITATQNEGKLSKTLLRQCPLNHWSKLHVAISHGFPDWILELSQPSSHSKKMPIKFQFYNPIVQRTTQFKTFGLIINHAKYSRFLILLLDKY